MQNSSIKKSIQSKNDQDYPSLLNVPKMYFHMRQIIDLNWSERNSAWSVAICEQNRISYEIMGQLT